MANGIVHSYAPTTVDDNGSTSTITAVSKTYRVSGDGLVFVTVSSSTDNKVDTGTNIAIIYHNGNIIAYNGNRLGTANNSSLGACASAGIAVSDGDTIGLTIQSSKDGTKDIYRHFLCVGCTVS